MNRDDWLSSSDPQAMLRFLRANGMASDRKQRLFAIACCRRIWPWLDEPCRYAVNTARRYVDFFANAGELEAANRDCWPPDNFDDGPPSASAAYFASADSGHYADVTADYACLAIPVANREVELGKQASLVRDVFGDPFDESAWTTSDASSDVVLIARAIYEGSLYEPLHYEDLAASIERETWGRDAALHCRNENDHVAGCWVVDRLLGYR